MPGLRGQHGYLTPGASEGRGGEERGQATVEWVALVLVVSVLLAGLIAVGVRLPGAGLVESVATKLLCAVSMADSCGDETALILAYGGEVGRLVRDHAPTLFFEPGRALPVDFRRCRSSACADGPEHGFVRRSRQGIPVTAFVHVVDCRRESLERSQADGFDCSGNRRGNLYLQFWLYYPESATLRGVPLAGRAGYHRDDWESIQFRLGPDGKVEQRASSHHGYNYVEGVANWASDAGIEPLRSIAEALGARAENGWGPATHALLVSGGSHAGSSHGIPHVDRIALGGAIHLVPLEEIAAAAATRFAVAPPWRKRVWTDPEADGTDYG